MASLLEGQLKRQVANAFRGKLLRGKGYKMTSTATDANGDPVASVVSSYNVEGSIDKYSTYTQTALQIPDTDMQVILIAGLCAAEPVEGDLLFLRGKWWVLGKRDTDPAEATHTFRASPSRPPL